VSRQPDIVVTGVGVVSPAGLDAATGWKSICAGESGTRHDPTLDGLRARFTGRVPDFDPSARLGATTARRTERFTQLALIAAEEALAGSGLDRDAWDSARVAVILGSAMGGCPTWEKQASRAAHASDLEPVSPLAMPMFLVNMVSGHVALRYRVTGPNFTASSACASGTTAIGLARDLLRSGACDVAITGGADASISRLTVAAFDRMDALSTRNDKPSTASRPFDTSRDGFVLSEGAAVLVLERAEDARARSAQPLARIAGYGASADAHHITAPHPDGAGLEQAIRAAAAEAGISLTDIDHVNAHATSTPLGDLAEAALLRRLLPHGPPVTAVKGAIGHTLGASGAIGAAVSVQSIVDGTIPPIANLGDPDPAVDLDVVTSEARSLNSGWVLCNSLGFGGQNASLIIAAA
jgi:3-oxoacyl-[acyl-carrier-protein] synthase II